MTKRQLKARVNELEDTLNRFKEEQHEINEMLEALNTKLEKLAYKGIVGPVDGDKLLAMLMQISISHGRKQCNVATLINAFINVLPRYKLNKGDEQK